ncbi:MAG TPA: molybdopterin cofactor-binding domain-containing protein [Xanthobacteraceae bacterium]
MPEVNRRTFLVEAVAAGGALTLGFAAPRGAGGAPSGAGEAPLGAGGAPASTDDPSEITAWVVIAPDDRVTIRVARSEMGQGSFTALPMLVAEELCCDWAKVKAEFVAPEENLRRKRVWGDMSTGGSRSVRGSQDFLRKAGATAREMLIAAAAAQWNVAAAECKAESSVITHGPSGRAVRFGQVAAAAAGIAPPKSVTLKEPRAWSLIGTPRRRLDVADKITGRTIYAIDVRLPDMLCAALAQCPVFGGTLKSADEQTIAGMPGVRRVVRFDDAVAVVADTWWQARKALDALPVAWDDGQHGTVSSASIAQFMRAGLDATEAGIGRQNGDVTAGLAQCATRIETDYHVPYLAHATLEPQNCTAHVTDHRVEIWVPTQHGESALTVAANAAGVSPRDVVVHRMMLGGGFGRRGIVQDFIPHAVKIALQMGRPVKTIWSREEDMRHDYYRPAIMARMTAGLDAAGMPNTWRVRLSGNSIIHTLFAGGFMGGVDRQVQEGFTDDMPYDVPNYLVDFAERNTHVPVGFWRGVSHSQNCFFKESFVDEMAHAAGHDPYDYRRRLIGRHPQAAKFLAVLDAAATGARWGAPLPAGRFRGIALEQVDNSFIAGVAEISIGGDGVLAVQRIVCALDCGHVVNPMTTGMQIESGIAFALTAALYGEISVADGRVQQSNFHDYPILRLADMPKVETILVPSGGFWGGVGEPPVAIVAPAICNAIFAATGKRIRSLPLRNHDLRKI